jgi:LysR family transcriptional activator of nhaA
MNYQHLFYFFTVAKQGGVSAAARALDLAPSTLSAQIRLLETSMARSSSSAKGAP